MLEDTHVTYMYIPLLCYSKKMRSVPGGLLDSNFCLEEQCIFSWICVYQVTWKGCILFFAFMMLYEWCTGWLCNCCFAFMMLYEWCTGWLCISRGGFVQLGVRVVGVCIYGDGALGFSVTLWEDLDQIPCNIYMYQMWSLENICMILLL